MCVCVWGAGGGGGGGGGFHLILFFVFSLFLFVLDDSEDGIFFLFFICVVNHARERACVCE